MNMHVMPASNRDNDNLPLGAAVVLEGIVIGRSEFQNGPPSYLIQFNKRGKVDREWFQLSDFKDTAT